MMTGTLNGDILFCGTIVLGHAFEISSMGIRVDETAMDQSADRSQAADDRREHGIP